LLPTGTTVAPPEAAPEDVAAPEAEAVAAPETEAVPARCNSPVPTRPSDVTAAIPPPEITASVATPNRPEARADGSSISELLFGTSSAEALTPLSDLIEGMRVFFYFFLMHSHVITLTEPQVEAVPLTQKGKKTKQPQRAPVARPKRRTRK